MVRLHSPSRFSDHMLLPLVKEMITKGEGDSCSNLWFPFGFQESMILEASGIVWNSTNRSSGKPWSVTGIVLPQAVSRSTNH